MSRTQGVDRCALCKGSKPLRTSHLIPAFVVRWLKETSATGYLRQVVRGNIRAQDGPRRKLLCGDCEERFSVVETRFAKEVFRPYVEIEIGTTGSAAGKIKGFQYAEWFLRFAISLQWRLLVTDGYPKELDSKRRDVAEKALSIWAEYLLDVRPDTGPFETHVIFLQSLLGATGDMLPNLHAKTSMYLIRSVDGTFVWSKKRMVVFSKIGPIAFLTTLIPERLRGMATSRVRKNGYVPVTQIIDDGLIGQFLFVDRPKEAFSRYKISEKQREKINEAVKKNPQRVFSSLSFAAWKADESLRKVRK